VIYSSTRAAAFDVRIIFANDSFRLPPMAVEGTLLPLIIRCKSRSLPSSPIWQVE
jgi:hypothetical protein